MPEIPSWVIAAGVGFAISVIVSVVFKRPSDWEELMDTLMDTGTFATAVGTGFGVGLVYVVF